MKSAYQIDFFNYVYKLNQEIKMPSRILLTLFTISFQLSTVFSQSQFQRTVGGPTNDYATSIIQTTDGGFAVAGSTVSFGGGAYDFYIVKLNSYGVLQWSRTAGGPNDERAFSIIQSISGGYYITGYTNSFGAGNYDVYTVKLAENGTFQTARTVGETDRDYAYSIARTTDGSYAIAGYNATGADSGDCYIVKFNSADSLQWSRTMGGTGGQFGYCVIQASDGGYVVAGQSGFMSAGYYDMYIVKFNSNGTFLWAKTIGGSNIDVANSVTQTTDGGYAMAGYTNSFGAGNNDMYIVKLDVNGSLQWNKTVGGSNSDYAWSIVQTLDGGYAVAGQTSSFGVGSFDMYVVKLDVSGTLQWSRAIGGGNTDVATSIVQTSDGGYVVAGSTNSFGAGDGDIYVVKLDASGNTCGNYNSLSSSFATGGSIGSPTSANNTPALTLTEPSSINTTGGIITTICAIGIQPISNEIPASFKLGQNYPNPFNPVTKIKFDIPVETMAPSAFGGEHELSLRIYDILGREVTILINEELKPGTYELEWNATDYPSGVYYYQLKTENFFETKRMVLMK